VVPLHAPHPFFQVGVVDVSVVVVVVVVVVVDGTDVMSVCPVVPGLRWELPGLESVPDVSVGGGTIGFGWLISRGCTLSGAEVSEGPTGCGEVEPSGVCVRDCVLAPGTLLVGCSEGDGGVLATGSPGRPGGARDGATPEVDFTGEVGDVGGEADF
jgi:hypothetical protein